MKIDKNKKYTVTQIANIAGVSKASVSRWLSERHVSPDLTKGKAKYFNATYLEQYLKAHRAGNSKQSDVPSPTSMLQEQVSLLKAENERLATDNKSKDEQLKQKDKEIAEYAKKFATLADQAQHLHLADQKHIMNADKSIERIASTIEAVNQPIEPQKVEEVETPEEKSNEEKNKKSWWKFWKK